MSGRFLFLFVLLITVFHSLIPAQDSFGLKYYDTEQNNLRSSLLLNKIKERSATSELYLVKFLGLKNLYNLDTITLPDTAISFIKENLIADEQNSFAWYGTNKQFVDNIFLSITNSHVAGKIHFDNKSYIIEPLEDEYHVLVLLNKSEDDCNCIDYDTTYKAEYPAESLKKSSAALYTTIPVIDVMVVYTPEAAASTGNINTLINGGIGQTITANELSGNQVELNLVYSGQVNYSESGDLITDELRLSSKNDGYMDEIHLLRDQYGADIVVLLTANGGPLCGWSHGVEVDVNGAFAAVKLSCINSQYTFAHEIGHLIGCRHDLSSDETLVPRAYAHGYVKKSQWRTMMALAINNEERVMFWSNPEKLLSGVPMGSESRENNNRVWQERGMEVANFVVKVPSQYPTISSALSSGAQRIIVLSGSFSETNDITVPVGCTLILNPGVNVSFAPGTSFIVNGLLTTAGASGNPVSLNRSGAAGTWSGIVFNSGAKMDLNYCNISNAVDGIHAAGASLNIYNSTISNCSTGIYAVNYYAGGSINNNLISNNITGIYLYNINPVISGNTITGNSAYGIQCNYYSSPYIFNNYIQNSQTAIYCNTYSNPVLLTSSYQPGNNVVIQNTNALISTYSSSPFLGSDTYHGNNSFSNISGYYISASYGGIIWAQYNCWNPFDPGKFIASTGATIYSTPYNCSSLLKSSIYTDIPYNSTDLSTNSYIELAISYEIKQDYEQAINIYKKIFESSMNSDIGYYCLYRMADCYSSVNFSYFIAYLNNLPHERTENYNILISGLYNKYLISEGKYDEVLMNLQKLTNKNEYSQEIIKNNLYNIFLLYLNCFNDITTAEQLFDKFRLKYPNDILTFNGNILLNNCVSLKSGEFKNIDSTTLRDNNEAELKVFPNPFNPKCSIILSIQLQSKVVIKIYNILGSEVKTIYNGISEPGIHNYVFDGTDFASGIYFARAVISSNNQAQYIKTAKLLLTK